MIKHLLTMSLITLLCIACSNKAKNTNSMINTDELGTDKNHVADTSSMYLLVGTYTIGETDGIYVFQFDTISGNAKQISSTKIINPSYLALSTDEKFVYAVTENDDKSAAANAYTFDKKEGTLKLLNSEATGGGAPCYIATDDAGKHVITANYVGGSISLFGIKSDGMLAPAMRVIRFVGKGADTIRQTQPHLHCVQFSPDGDYLFANDLGTDKIYKFEVNKSGVGDFLKMGKPAFYKVKDGSGPRHLTFHPNGKYAYLITEMAGTVIAYTYDKGNLTEIQTILCDSLNAQGSGDIHISPDGKFLYASNRLKNDGIAIFSINDIDGKLVKVGYQETGIHPRNFVITPNGKFLLVACRDTNTIQVLARDLKTGLLTNTSKDITLTKPVCLKFASFN